MFLNSETDFLKHFSLGFFANCLSKHAKSLPDPKGVTKNNTISIIHVQYTYNNLLVK